MSSIPCIIHQTWRDNDVPPYLRRFQASWREHHPAWQYRLWTDEANRRLIEEHYPQFLPVYDTYPLPIQRADAVRYFILHRYGGLYVDLDFECLRPLEPMLAGRSSVFGVEPRAHAVAHGVSLIVGNALMASTPGHRVWPEVHSALVQHSNALDAWGRRDVLRSTGPLLLTNVVQRYGTDEVTLFPPDVFYPQLDAANSDLFASKSEQSYYQGKLRQGLATPNSYAVHHWAGAWTTSWEIKQALIEEASGERP